MSAAVDLLTLGEAARTVRAAAATRTWVYFIRSGKRGPVKIGIARNPRERLATLQQGNPTKLRLIAVFSAFTLEERQLHDEFADERIAGEWFRPSRRLLSLGRRLNDPLVLEDFTC